VKLVLASANPGKLREISALLGPLGHELIDQSALGIASPAETGSTFIENALLKARHAAHHARLPALADDSGIEVDVLSGRPGVHSARYAGPRATDRENLEKMLNEMQGNGQRTARYQCVIALVRSADDPRPLIATGSWSGRILEAPRGSRGFGYDPIFLPDGSDLSAAELEPLEKNRHSHRAQALRALVEQLQWQS
jgi:XTP/dITP diphosphohydrolase